MITAVELYTFTLVLVTLIEFQNHLEVAEGGTKTDAALVCSHSANLDFAWLLHWTSRGCCMYGRDHDQRALSYCCIY